ncbi:hypothetical protein [Aminobacter aminovorans]|uniref:hypothetical protein n=1 Tax=Aminobacter aminovorans TaxID=83263 RepID=UPI00285AA82E|nr:hypothetical protein [Aminobacter aminovorans]MDR7220323.1 phosphoribulokinase [Aminobacter aminovorans]
MIERHEGRQQIVCDTCPASFAHTYADADFRIMIDDAKAKGWRISQAKTEANPRDTSDLFGKAPTVAGKAKVQPYTHKCPACCAKPQQQGRLT